VPLDDDPESAASGSSRVCDRALDQAVGLRARALGVRLLLGEQRVGEVRTGRLGVDPDALEVAVERAELRVE
jgi:hypothetical protein